MITAQDIQEKTFEKAFNGYNMGQVDEFLDEMAAEITAMAKENAALKGKMRVLVEKVEEYRQTEDSMRLALLSAQKMGAQIETEAKQRAEKLVSEAQARADALRREAEAGVANETAKLNKAKESTQRYIDHMTAVCQKQIEFYGKLAQAQLVGAAKPTPAPVEDDEEDEDTTVRAIEDSAVKSALKEPETALPLDELLGGEEEPTRMFAAEAAPKKRKRSRAEFIFEDDED